VSESPRPERRYALSSENAQKTQKIGSPESPRQRKRARDLWKERWRLPQRQRVKEVYFSQRNRGKR